MAYKVKNFFRVFRGTECFLNLIGRRNRYVLRRNRHIIIKGFKKLCRYVHRAVDIDRSRAVLEDAVQINLLNRPDMFLPVFSGLDDDIGNVHFNADTLVGRIPIYRIT